MNTSTNMPLTITNRLAPNPSSSPKYKTQVKYKNGEHLWAADPQSTRALVALMDMHAVLGGAASHYGGPAAFAEIMSALHAFVFDFANKNNKQWYELFNVVNDAGHCENGLYALKANYNFAGLTFEKLKKFRSIDSVLTGHGEAHLFPEAVLISNGPLGSALPQAQGLAMADHLAQKNRVTITCISDGASMEGEAKEAFAAIPGLAARGLMQPFVMIISDNNTKLSGRIDKDSFSMQPTFLSLATMGWKVVEVKNGNNLQDCFTAIETVIEEVQKNPKIPIAIHARTVKGIGHKKSVESASGGHGFPLKGPAELAEFLKEIYAGQEVPQEFLTWALSIVADHAKNMSAASAVKTDKIQAGVSAALIDCKKQGLPIVSISSDLQGSTGLAAFHKEFPQSSFDIGVAESNMVSVAAGFSKVGFIPVVDTFAQFGVTKGALPLTMASLSEAPMICVFSHTGFQDAADGASHQALSYLAMLSSIPNVDTYCLTCADEAKSLITQAVQKFARDAQQNKHPRTSVFFLGRENFPLNFGSSQYQLGKAQVVQDITNLAKSVTVIAAGSSLQQGVEAAALLKEKGIECLLVNPSLVNHADTKTLSEAVNKTQGRVVFVEDHQLTGGMGQMIAAQLLEKNIVLKAKFLAVREAFGQSAYMAVELYKKHHIDSGAIVKAALELL